MIIDKSIPSASLAGLGLSNLVDYLRSTGWDPERTNRRWFIFTGGQDARGRPLEIVLPRDPEDSDLSTYIKNAVELIAATLKESIEITARKVRLFDRDILKIRNLETGEEASISLQVAWKQVSEVRQLVLFSAESEKQARPYFPKNRVNRQAQKMAEQYRFGHTFMGSFGLTIESPIVNQQRVYQMSLLDHDRGRVVVPPIERRVMERIVRGLVIAENAPRIQDMDLLRDQYTSGFNANMCQAVIGIAKDQRAAVEFTVDWSPKIEPSQDLEETGPIRLSEVSYDYLDYAARQLKEIQPEPVIVRGLVESLTAKGDPRSLSGSDRTIVIRWNNPPSATGRSRNVIMKLNTEEYLAAIHAHENYQHVSVQGDLQQTGNIWRLSNPTNFRIE